MKKRILLLILALLCGALAGCGQKPEEEQVSVYSFCGENEFFSVSNGVIVLTEEKDTIYCGRLQEKQELPSEIVSFTEEIYLVTADGNRDCLISSSLTDLTGDSVAISNKRLIGRSGSELVDAQQERLKDNLYFELVTTGRGGEKNEYQIQLEVTEVTDHSAEVQTPV